MSAGRVLCVGWASRRRAAAGAAGIGVRSARRL